MRRCCRGRCIWSLWNKLAARRLQKQSEMKIRTAKWLGLLAALGMSSTGWGQYEPVRLSDSSRRWAVTLGVRGEYDDNINTSSTRQEESFKTIVEPQFLLNVPGDQTFLGLRYNYRTSYYDSRPKAFDHSHQADVQVSHTVSRRLLLDLQERFRYGVEPDLVDDQGGVELVRRRRGDFYNNNLSGGLSYNLSRRWTTTVRGAWDYWDYVEAVNSGNDRNQYQGVGTLTYGLDRRTTVGGSYRYQELIYQQPGTNDYRNSTSHALFGTVVRRFSPQFSGRLSAGMELRESGDGASDVGPYVDSSVTYLYAPGSSATAGFRYSISSTEVGAYRSSDAASVFLQVVQRITPKFYATGSFVGGINTYNGSRSPGFVEGDSEQVFSCGLGLQYRFTRWCSAEGGYNFDTTSSDIEGRDFVRNRISLGARFEY